MKQTLIALMLYCFFAGALLHGQVVLETGSIQESLFLDGGLYYDFDAAVDSVHLLARLTYGMSRSTAFFIILDYGTYFPDSIDTSGLAVGVGAEFALVKRGEFSQPLAGSFVLRGDIDVMDDLKYYNMLAYTVFSYAPEHWPVIPYAALGLRYTDYTYEAKELGEQTADSTRGFVSAGACVPLSAGLRMHGEISYSKDLTASLMLRWRP